MASADIKVTVKVEIDQPVPLIHFGRDHWSTLAYLECRGVDDGGFVDHRHMRRNIETHAEIPGNLLQWSPANGTRLKDGTVLPAHDDWDCVADMQAAGLILPFIGVDFERHAAHGKVVLTQLGQAVASGIRAHKAAGGTYSTFAPAS